MTAIIDDELRTIFQQLEQRISQRIDMLERNVDQRIDMLQSELVPTRGAIDSIPMVHRSTPLTTLERRLDTLEKR